MAKKTDEQPKEESAQESFSMEMLRGKTPEEIKKIVDTLDVHLKAMHQEDNGELRSLTEDEDKAFKAGIAIREKGLAMLEEHERVSAIFRKTPKAVEGIFNIVKNESEGEDLNVRRMTSYEAREKALKQLDGRQAHGLRNDQREQVEGFIRKDADIARRIIVTENEAYRTAWMKLVTDPNAAVRLSEEERTAVRAFGEYEQYRAAAESPTSAGGFGIPVFIDPSIILTGQGTANPFLTLARQATINTNVWKGVNSAGVTWSFDAEGTAVSDDAATLAQPSITVFMARGFIPYSIELGQDYPSFAEEMATLLASGYDELLVDKLTRGNGTTEPQGILTALSANTNVRVKVQTAGQFGANDPYAAWAALPQRFQRNANWLMSVATNNSIRKLATANVYHAYTVNLPQRAADSLFESPVYMDPYMPDQTAFTTTVEGIAVVGDFSNYVLVRRGGMSVELVPTLFDVTNNRPTGQRGWFAYARVGGGSANDLGFRLLVNS